MAEGVVASGGRKTVPEFPVGFPTTRSKRSGGQSGSKSLLYCTASREFQSQILWLGKKPATIGSGCRSFRGPSRSLLRHLDFDRLADIPPAGKVPGVWKAPALSRLDRLDPAVATLEKNAGSVRLVGKRQPVAGRPQAGESFNKLRFPQAQMPRDRRDVPAADFDKARPPAAIRAALAGKVFHGFRTGYASPSRPSSAI